MKNFKEIAEKCLAGELSGTFILRNHTPLHSKYLYRYKIGRDTIYGYYWLGGIVLNEKGEDVPHKERIQNFIPDNMQEQIKIDIPEGKVAVMEQTENGIVITWKEKELTYNDISNYNWEHGIHIGVLTSTVVNENATKFSKKVEVLRKLTNIRNYFGKPDENKCGWFIEQSGVRVSGLKSKYYPNIIMFAEKKHAEEAIKMLGDELKYLFEPW